jgi:pimeloyl-ACP methyl ester carboxylesterase
MSIRQSLKRELPLLLIGTFLGLTGLLAYAASKFTPGKMVVIVAAAGILGFIAAFVFLAARLRDIRSILISAGLSILAIVVGGFLILFTFIFFFQDAVANRTSSFFQPRRILVETAQELTAPDVIPLDLTTPDGIHLRGWLVWNSAGEKTPLVIYFGGSGSESSEMIPMARQLEGWSVALVNYRGFGQSEGTPTHEDTLSDARLLYDELAARPDIDSSQVVAMGYSLGTGVAVQLAEQRPVAGTILVSPYDHWSLIGLNKSPLYAPLSGIMKPYFDSISLAPDIHSPVLFLIGAEDAVVPSDLSIKLAGSWGGKTTVKEYPGEDHGLLFHENNSWEDIERFLHSLP